jgi:hypothetical protein
MKNKDLQKILKHFPEDIDICIFDLRANQYCADEEGSSVGIYPEFKIECVKDDNVPEGCKPFLALAFKNTDYDENGNKLD